MNKKAFEIQFHWIFVMIAGGLILLFFFTVAQRQQKISTEHLQITLVTAVDDILTKAIVSKGTAQRLPIPPDGIGFTCAEGCACDFRVGAAREPFGDKPIFAPALLKDQDVTVWAIDFRSPYRVTNLLYLTNPTIKYYFVADPSNPQSKGLLDDLTKKIPALYDPAQKKLLPVLDYENITQTQITSLKAPDATAVRFVFLYTPPPTLDDTFRNVAFSGIRIDADKIGFYEKQGTGFNSVAQQSYLGLPSIFAAVFSSDHLMYECGLRTVFRKLFYVSTLYVSRAQDLQESMVLAQKPYCIYDNLAQLLAQQQSLAGNLSLQLDKSKMSSLVSTQGELQDANQNLFQQSCAGLF